MSFKISLTLLHISKVKPVFRKSNCFKHLFRPITFNNCSPKCWNKVTELDIYFSTKYPFLLTIPNSLLLRSMYHKVRLWPKKFTNSSVIVSVMEHPEMSTFLIGRQSRIPNMAAAPSLPIGFRRKLIFSRWRFFITRAMM